MAVDSVAVDSVAVEIENQTATDSVAEEEVAPSEPKVSVETITVNGVSFEMIRVEAGSFTMGATPEMEDTYEDEAPTHQVSITNDFFIGKTEVTQALWKAVMGSNPSHFKGDGKPVEQVSWDDCQKFILKLNAATGRDFRLPTEAEWEFAARGGNQSTHCQYSGSNSWEDVIWCNVNSGKTTHDVATLQPNELGLYDMSGNVSEWCSDWYEGYSGSSLQNPTGALTGTERVYRGGSWETFPAGGRSSWRQSLNPEKGFWALGLRLVLSGSSSTETANNAATSNWVLTVKGVNYEMVKVQAGTFTMGSTLVREEDDADTRYLIDNDKPAHQVTLTQNYYMGKTEVTQALWKAVMGNNPSKFKGDDKPVENVSWDDCQAFITQLNALTGKEYRLPTEAEWEFAARGGNKSLHYLYSGSNSYKDIAWYLVNSGKATHNVATKQPNELGLYDMSGNVLEWCSDWYGKYDESPLTNPVGASTGTFRVTRGGAWGCQIGFCRSSVRSCTGPNDKSNALGLRLVLSE